MSETPPETTGRQQGGRFGPGRSGNPGGRPVGARNKTTIAAEMLLDGAAEAIVARCIRMALGGDQAAIRVCMDRIVPPRRERPVSFKLPRMKTAADAAKATAALARAVSRGELLPGEAAELAKLVESFTRALEVAELEVRIAELEQRLGGKT